MVNGVHPAEQVGDEIAVARVSFVEVDFRAEVSRRAVPVHWPGQCIEHDHLMPLSEKAVTGVGSDEAGPPGYENPHRRPGPLRSATSRYVSSVAAAVAPQVNWLARRIPSSRRWSLSGASASIIAFAIEAGSVGSDRIAAPPAVSGIALVSEVTTGQPHAMASSMGSPKVSFRDG